MKFTIAAVMIALASPALADKTPVNTCNTAAYEQRITALEDQILYLKKLLKQEQANNVKPVKPVHKPVNQFKKV